MTKCLIGKLVVNVFMTWHPFVIIIGPQWAVGERYDRYI